MTIFPYSRMSFGQAMFWLDRGYFVRRAIWRLTDALPFQIAGPSDIALRWFYGLPVNERPGLYVYKSAGATGAVITNLLLTQADMLADDWTCDAVDPGVDSYDPATTNPNAGKPGAEESGGALPAASSGSGGDSSGAGGSASGFSGTGGGGGSGGGGTGGKPSKNTPLLTPPSVFFSAWSLAGPPWEYPISGSGSSAAIITTSPETEAFGGFFFISSSPGDLFFLNIVHGSPTGFQTIYHGTCGSGQTKDFTFNITALPRETQWPWMDPSIEDVGVDIIPGSGAFAVTATAYIPNRPGSTVSRSLNVYMRPHAQRCPGGTYNRFIGECV